eukprot:scaffold80882_cov63-Phaeocystis_antarctica.AAC.1
MASVSAPPRRAARALGLPEPRRLRARGLRPRRAGGRLGRLPPVLPLGARRRARAAAARRRDGQGLRRAATRARGRRRGQLISAPCMAV